MGKEQGSKTMSDKQSKDGAGAMLRDIAKQNAAEGDKVTGGLAGIIADGVEKQSEAETSSPTSAPVDLVETLLDAYDETFDAADGLQAAHRRRDGIRAILTELAAMGVKDIPHVDVEAIVNDAEFARALYDRDRENPANGTRDGINEALDRFGHSIAPILAAKDALTKERDEWRLVAEFGDEVKEAAIKEADRLRAKVAELEARVWILEIAPKAAAYANEQTEEERPGLEQVDWAAEAISTNAPARGVWIKWSEAVLEYAAKARSVQ